MKQIIRRIAALIIGLGLGATALAGLESVTHISDLNSAWPLGSDLASTSDDHIRNIKVALKTDFPNVNAAVTPTPTQFNQLTTDTFTTKLTINGVTGAGGFLGASASANAAITADFTNSSTGSSASSYIRAINSADAFVAGISSTSGSFSPFFTNGPTGEQVFIGTTTSVPLSIGTNNTERVRIVGAGNVTINAPTSGSALTVSGVAGASNYAAVFTGANSSGSRGVNILGGTGASDFALVVNDAANSKNLLLLSGSGALSVYGPTAATSVDVTPDNGSWTATFSGAISTTGTVKWRRVGNQAFIYVDANITATAGSATTITFNGVPAAITPAAPRLCITMIFNNGANAVGTATANTNNTVTLWPGFGPSANFTNGVVDGIAAGATIIYPL